MRTTASFFITFLTILGIAACGGGAPEGAAPGSSFSDIVEASEREEGYLTFLTDQSTGDVHLLLKSEQLDTEIIHYWMGVNGNVPVGHFVGRYGGSQILKFRRHFNRIEIVQENTRFYFDPENALSKAATANIPAAILAVEDIVAEDESTGEILISLKGVLLKEKLMQIKRTPDPEAPPKQTFTMGKLSETRNKIVRTKSYPENSDVVVEYVYENPAPLAPASEDVTDPRAMSVQIQHSFVAVPDNNYQPRFEDYRVGYFTDRITDLTDPGYTPYRDVINRWQLVKKEPGAALSEPVEPITWWIENTTPHEYRDLIRDATLAWNSSFEKAGFKNAMVVKVQPDDAEWDAGDLRYNVLRWTSSPVPPFGGYGPSFSNPRTGQILGADIMLEFVYVRNHRRAQVLAQPDAHAHDPAFCNAGMAISENFLFANSLLEIFDASKEQQQQLLRDALYNLTLHEVGHAIGLNHNMAATQVIDDPFDPDQVAEHGLSGSVMDYADINFAPPGKTQTLYYQITPGTYDDWAIEFGYSEGLADAEEEAERLEKILARSGEPGLIFGNDADDMRAPTNGLDPRIQINDLSSDAIGYAVQSMEHLVELAPAMPTKLAEGEDSWDKLTESYRRLVGRHGRAADVIASYIGGVYIHRAPPGSTDERPFTPVSRTDQKRAMDALSRLVFAPDATIGSDDLFAHLQRKRRGFDFYGNPEDPRIHQAWQANNARLLDRLLHPTVLQRISDSRMYGNEYSVFEMVNDLTNAIFEADRGGDVNTMRQSLQTLYTKKLIAGVAKESPIDSVAQSALFASLENIQEIADKRRRGNDETRAHARHLAYMIEVALDS